MAKNVIYQTKLNTISGQILTATVTSFDLASSKRAIHSSS